MIDEIVRGAAPAVARLIVEIVRAIVSKPAREQARAARRALAAVTSEELSEAVLKRALGPRKTKA